MTFDQLPAAVESLAAKMDRIEALLLKERVPELPDLMSTIEVAAMLGLAPATITQKVWKGEIPHFKQGRKLRFSRADVEKWVRDAKVNTAKESFNLKYTRK